jgi:hypothetical protein
MCHVLVDYISYFRVHMYGVPQGPGGCSCCCGLLHIRPVLVGVSSEFDFYLISFHISDFDDVTTFLRRQRRNEFHGMKLSWHDYQLYQQQQQSI